jgi:hypothetical protein
MKQTCLTRSEADQVFNDDDMIVMGVSFFPRKQGSFGLGLVGH